MRKIIFSHDFRQTALNQLWKLFSGPLLMFMVPLYLTADAQGYWFTFISLAALVVFADLGFSTILLQLSAHEFAHLNFTKYKTLSGSSYHLERQASLLSFAVKWSSVMAILVFPLVLVAGYTLLNEKNTLVNWQYPWLIYCVASIFIFINSVLLSFIEGCDSVGDVQKIRFHISFLTVTSTIVFLLADMELYALAVSLLIGGLSGLLTILHRYHAVIFQLYAISKQTTHVWTKEIIPLMWRYAVSGISGYFMFSVFTPIAFYYYGSLEAGQVGLTIAVCAAIFAIANIWMTMIVPKMNIYVAQGDYEALNRVFKQHILLSLITYLFGASCLLAITNLFADSLPFVSRLVSPSSLLIISLAWLMQVFLNGITLYMRAYKEERLVFVFLFSAIYITLTTWLAVLYLPFDYYFIGFLSAYIWIQPAVLVFFVRQYKRVSINNV